MFDDKQDTISGPSLLDKIETEMEKLPMDQAITVGELAERIDLPVDTVRLFLVASVPRGHNYRLAYKNKQRAVRHVLPRDQVLIVDDKENDLHARTCQVSMCPRCFPPKG